MNHIKNKSSHLHVLNTKHACTNSNVLAIFTCLKHKTCTAKRVSPYFLDKKYMVHLHITSDTQTGEKGQVDLVNISNTLSP